VFRCNLAVEEEERVQTRMSRLGGCLASWGRTLSAPLTQCLTPMYFISLPGAIQWMQIPVLGKHVLLRKVY